MRHSSSLFSPLVMLCGASFGLLLFVCGCDATRKDSKDRVAVRFMLWGGAEELTNLRASLASEFEPANPNIRVELQPIQGNSYQAKLATMLAGGVAPDMFMIHDAFLPTAARNSLLLPLDAFAAADPDIRLEQFFPSVVEKCRRNGSLLTLPESFSTVMLYYNKDLFDAEGLAYPNEDWTWADMREAAIRLTKRDARGFTTQFGLDGPGKWLSYLYFIWQNGGEVFDENERLVIGRPEYLDQNVEALRFMGDLCVKDRVVPSISTADVLPADPFLAGRIGIVLIGTWRNSSLFQNYEATRGNPGQADFRWGVAPLPKQKHRATIYFGGGPVIYSGTRRAREAWEVLKFYTSDEWQEAVAKRGRGVPAKMEIAERVFLKLPAIPEGEDFSVILRSLEYARPQPSGREVAEIMEGSLRMLCDNVAAGRVPDIRAEILRMQREYDDPNPYNPLVREARTKK